MIAGYPCYHATILGLRITPINLYVQCAYIYELNRFVRFLYVFCNVFFFGVLLTLPQPSPAAKKGEEWEGLIVLSSVDSSRLLPPASRPCVSAVPDSSTSGRLAAPDSIFFNSFSSVRAPSSSSTQSSSYRAHQRLFFLF